MFNVFFYCRPTTNSSHDVNVRTPNHFTLAAPPWAGVHCLILRNVNKFDDVRANRERNWLRIIKAEPFKKVMELLLLYPRYKGYQYRNFVWVQLWVILRHQLFSFGVGSLSVLSKYLVFAYDVKIGSNIVPMSLWILVSYFFGLHFSCGWNHCL